MKANHTQLDPPHMTYPTLMLDVPEYDPEPLRRWGHRVGLKARMALHLSGNLTNYLKDAPELGTAITVHFGTDSPSHSFHAEPHHWLRLTERQTTMGLASFLTEGGSDRVLAFLRALAPEIAWPGDLCEVRALAEAPAPKGRIDLLVTGTSGGKVWGAAVEAKFRHHPRHNPFSAYRNAALAEQLVIAAGPGSEPTGALRILGQVCCGVTTQRLNKNKDWRFVGWKTVLRRWEFELRGLPDDDEFRRFRRTVWERAR